MMSENANKNTNENNEIEKLADAKLNDDATEQAAGGFEGIDNTGDFSHDRDGQDVLNMMIGIRWDR